MSESIATITGRDIRKLAFHSTVWTLASALSATFSAVYLLRAGLSPAQIFLCFAAILALRFVTRATAAVAVAIGTTMVGGFYLPSWLTAAYSEARVAPCTFRFQFAAEGGWDAGGVAAGLIAAAFCALGLPAAAAIPLALPMVAVQGWLLSGSYARQMAQAGDPRVSATA